MLFRRDGQLGLEAVGQGPGKLAIPIELDGGGRGHRIQSTDDQLGLEAVG